MPPRKKAVTGSTPVEDLRHDDTRANIPTGELAGFVPDEVTPPVRYPRDPSLDPQLVWRGKDEQDSADLEVPSVPIYVQEKVVPRAIVEDLRRAGPVEDDAPSLFDDFDGLDFGDKVDFYAHEANWSNRMILGDSLLAMTSLAEREGLRGKVQMIYLDPPYGIRFGSNWQVSTRKRDVKDGKVEDATRQPEQVKAFRDTWELGIHSYLAYLRDRLVVARELLTESGSCFVQIGDENVHLVRSLMDEVFGSENFFSSITYLKTSSSTAEFGGTADTLLCYAKTREAMKFRPIFNAKATGGAGASGYTRVRLADGTSRPLSRQEVTDNALLPDGARVFAADNLTSQSMGRQKGEGAASWFTVTVDGRDYDPGMKARWKTNAEGMARLQLAGRVIATSGRNLAYQRFLDDFPATPLSNVWTDTLGQNQFGGDKQYVVQTALVAVQRCMLMTTDPGDLVLDPTCGSGTTAYVAEQWGRRWITTDTSRVALTLARTRLMSAKLPYYLLADTPEGRRKEAELAGLPPGAPAGTRADVRKGFVYKRVPHVTLKSIANNPDIREGMSRQEIDTAIARHADSELLYDQPYEDKARVRVAGPFTVESLAPHRTVAQPERTAPVEANGASYEQTVLDNLKKAGVQNGWRSERLTFDRIEPFAGQWIQAIGHAVGEPGSPERVGIALGPQYGTVDADLVQQAAKEAVRGAGLDLLLVCGFAFDPRASEKAKEFAPTASEDFAVAQGEQQYGRLPVLLVRVNPDLAMGDALLKATGAGNLFTVFGEPDITLDRTVEGLVVEIRGLDVYDPTTGTVRSSTTDDIACWFIDTDYDEESFFVKHAYFTGADEPYAKLQRALRAEVDEEAWASLYRTRSRPFPTPGTGKIAVKVVNHYGDEVLQVYDVR
jgi:adenine-specific DNA-methyltransferase